MSTRTAAPYANQSHLHLPSISDASYISSHLSPQILAHPLKSLQVKNTYSSDSQTPDSYSRLQILKSPAGYYIGTIYIDPEHLFEEPGSRDTNYFPSLDSALRAFEYLTTLAISGNSEYPFDLATWETKMTAELKISVKYRSVP